MALDQSRILAKQSGPERVLDELDRRPTGDRARVGVPDARVARIGVDPDEDVLPGGELAGGDGGGFFDRYANDDRTDVGDLHGDSAGFLGGRDTSRRLRIFARSRVNGAVSFRTAVT